MRRLLLAAPLALLACDPPPPASSKAPAAQTTIQHDAAPSAPAQAAPTTDTGELPPNHPKLGDGAKSHDDAPASHPGVPEESNAKELLAKVEAMKDELKTRPKTIEITVALGSLYYDNGRYLDAIDYYRQAVAQGESLLARFRKVEQAVGKTDELPLTEAGCDRVQLRDSEPMMARAEELAAKKPGAALACAREAVRPVVMAHTRRGNAFYLIGNPAEAVREHEASLAIDPEEPESLFFRGAILFDAMGDDVAKLKVARASWQEFLRVAPESARAKAVANMLPQLDEAIRLGGASKLPKPQAVAENGPPGMAPALDPGIQDAVQSTEVTPELVDGFGKILDEATAKLAQGDADGARTDIVRVFPFVMADLQKQPPKIPAGVRARAQALMGLYMQGKGAPMGGAMLAQAAGADAKSVDALGDALAKAGDAAHAKALWTALTQAAPDYAQGAKVADKLR